MSWLGENGAAVLWLLVYLAGVAVAPFVIGYVGERDCWTDTNRRDAALGLPIVWPVSLPLMLFFFAARWLAEQGERAARGE